MLKTLKFWNVLPEAIELFKRTWFAFIPCVVIGSLTGEYLAKAYLSEKMTISIFAVGLLLADFIIIALFVFAACFALGKLYSNKKHFEPSITLCLRLFGLTIVNMVLVIASAIVLFLLPALAFFTGSVVFMILGGVACIPLFLIWTVAICFPLGMGSYYVLFGSGVFKAIGQGFELCSGRQIKEVLPYALWIILINFVLGLVAFGLAFLSKSTAFVNINPVNDIIGAFSYIGTFILQVILYFHIPVVAHKHLTEK